MKQADFSVLSARRSDLCGIAIISIVVYHFFERGSDVVAGVFNAFEGSVGVPIFLMLSGVGLFFSMSKAPTLSRFYKKRFLRIAVPYALIGGVHLFVRMILIEKKGFGAFLREFFFVEFITKGDKQFWFIVCILLLYAVFPLLFKVYANGAHIVLKTVALIGAVVVCNLALKFFLPALYANTEVMLTRIPAFIGGVYLGQKAYTKQAIPLWLWIFSGAGSAVFLYLSVRQYLFAAAPPAGAIMRYGQTVYALLLMSALALLLQAADIKMLSKVLAFFSAMSLELYLVHVSLRTLMRLLSLPVQNALYYGIMAVAAVSIAYVMQRFDSFAVKTAMRGKNTLQTDKKDVK